MYYTDVRMDKPVFTLSAHTESVTGLAISSQLPGLLITASTDKSMKVWDVQDNKPAMVLEKDMKVSLCTGIAISSQLPGLLVKAFTGKYYHAYHIKLFVGLNEICTCQDARSL